MLKCEECQKEVTNKDDVEEVVFSVGGEKKFGVFLCLACASKIKIEFEKLKNERDKSV